MNSRSVNSQFFFIASNRKNQDVLCITVDNPTVVAFVDHQCTDSRNVLSDLMNYQEKLASLNCSIKVCDIKTMEGRKVISMSNPTTTRISSAPMIILFSRKSPCLLIDKVNNLGSSMGRIFSKLGTIQNINRSFSSSRGNTRIEDRAKNLRFSDASGVGQREYDPREDRDRYGNYDQRSRDQPQNGKQASIIVGGKKILYYPLAGAPTGPLPTFSKENKLQTSKNVIEYNHAYKVLDRNSNRLILEHEKRY